MRRLRGWFARLAGSFSSRGRERDLAAELESHFQMHVDDNVRAGMAPEEAYRQARLRFGPIESIKETYRDRRGFPLVARAAQDLRFAARLLRKSPAFSVAAIATIALSVGANAAIFSVVNAAALRELAVPAGSRLATVTIGFDGPGSRGVSGMPSMLSYAEFLAVRDGTPAFEQVLAFAPFQPLTLGGAQPREVLATLASCEYFDTLRVPAALGRTFVPRDCAGGAAATVVLSDSLWRASFNADPGVVGRAITFNRVPFVIIGVAAPGFKGTQILNEEAFIPLTWQPALSPDVPLLDRPNTSWLYVIGRLRDGSSLATVRASLAVLAARLTAASPPGRIVHLDAGRTTLAGLPEIRSMVLAAGGIITVAVALVLLIACANIANLLLARAAARRKEIAIRLALGAGRGRLVQQLLTESLLLAAIGGVIGCISATWAVQGVIRFVLAHLPPGIAPIVFEPRADWRVALYAVVLTTVTGVTFGLVPALQATRGRLALRGESSAGGTTGGWLRPALVALQVAVSLVLLLAAGLLSRGLYRANTIDPGIAVADVSIVSYNLRSAGYTAQSAAVFQQRAKERLQALSGVRLVAEAGSVPLSDQHTETQFALPGSDRAMFIEFAQVEPAYFAAVGVPLVRGRLFSPDEVASQRAVIVSESTARRLWPGADPLAQALILDKAVRPVVGVTRDAQIARLGQPDAMFVFLPAGPESQINMRMLVSGGGVTARALRDAVSSLDPELPVDVARLADNLELWRAPSRLFAALAVALAALALVLACTGVFGTVAYGVSRRVPEIAIRVALGARHHDVLRLIVRQGMLPVCVGMALGLGAAAAVSRVLVNMLFGLSPHDPLSFAGVPLVFFAVALIACYLPARRALRVQPTSALRAD